eukprot:gb/GEZN01012138.1/.p1 GENE.gb/GEZN01012138.1/~~gb/GEZN01012138.1/.p1  ORF type:complete len:342 (+),score=59.96 gb/GEZN01012138.1/:30-1028(+)
MGNVFDKEVDCILPEEDLASLHSPSGSWQLDEDVLVCLDCETVFSLMQRKHHCRFCGRIFCHDCCAIVTGREMARTCDRCGERLEHHHRALVEGRLLRSVLFPTTDLQKEQQEKLKNGKSTSLVDVVRNSKGKDIVDAVSQSMSKLLHADSEDVLFPTTQDPVSTGCLIFTTVDPQQEEVFVSHSGSASLFTTVDLSTSPEDGLVVPFQGRAPDFKFDPSKFQKVTMTTTSLHPLAGLGAEEEWGIIEREDTLQAMPQEQDRHTNHYCLSQTTQDEEEESQQNRSREEEANQRGSEKEQTQWAKQTRGEDKMALENNELSKAQRLAVSTART